jgi:hypothetical protein
MKIELETSLLQEWGDARSVNRSFGIGETTLYYHAKNGDIESKLLRLPGHKRGKRLFNFASIRQLLNSLPNGEFAEVPWARKNPAENKGRPGRPRRNAA